MVAPRKLTGPDMVDGDDYFHFLRASWNVTDGLARAARAGTEPRDADVQSWFGLIPMVRINREHVATADLTRPLLFVSSVVDPDTGEDAGPFLIDGWHRLARARDEGVNWLPCLVLDKDDSVAIVTRWWK
jgi:hypothetical protein